MKATHEPTPRELFEERLGDVEAILAWTCRRCGFGADESEEFRGWAMLKLIENDYRPLRRFRGTSSLTTYLTVVIQNLARDFRIHRWGRFRPSRAALRLGETAVRLERLLVRDELDLASACRVLRENYGVVEDDRELERLAASLPRRERHRHAPAEPGPEPPREAESDGRLLLGERSALADRARRALLAALAALDVEDRRLLALRFAEGRSVASIARRLGLNQRRLYSRLDRIFGRLRRELEARGVAAGEVREVVGGPEVLVEPGLLDSVASPSRRLAAAAQVAVAP